MALGICNAVYPCDRDGNVGSPPLSSSDDAAVDIFFSINTAVSTPPQDQLELKRDIERMLHALSRLFLSTGKLRGSEFRPYYVQLLHLAELGLAGPTASPDIAKRALEGVTAELIDNEGGGVKNGHMKDLSGWALLFSAPCLLVYLLLRSVGSVKPIANWFKIVSIDPTVLSCFMILWVGCFLGVVLSYGARTTTMTLSDLTNVDADRLLPQFRLVFAGALAMIIGVLLVLKIVEFKIGASVSSSEIADYPMVAFLVGTLCGISELALPGAVTKKATGLLDLK